MPERTRSVLWSGSRGAIRLTYTVGGPTVGFINQNCFTEPYLPTSAVASLPYGCAGFPNAGTSGFIPNAPSGISYCSNLMPLNVGRNTITALTSPTWTSRFTRSSRSRGFRRLSTSSSARRYSISSTTPSSVPPQPNSGDSNSALINPDGSYADVGNIISPANLQTPAREIQFALKMNW